MILSITDGIEVAEHTEPQERCEFLAQYRAERDRAECMAAIESSLSDCAFLRRQAE